MPETFLELARRELNVTIRTQKPCKRSADSSSEPNKQHIEESLDVRAAIVTEAAKQ